MGSRGRMAHSGSADDGKAPDQAAGSVYIPQPSGWLAAASEVPASVLVGSRDTAPQAPEPGQQGSTRIERATAWINSMNQHAVNNGRTPMIQFVQAEGLDHDEPAMAAARGVRWRRVFGSASPVLRRCWSARPARVRAGQPVTAVPGALTS